MSNNATLDPAAGTRPPRERAAYLPIVFAVVAIVGLGLWFSGGGDAGEPTSGGLVGAGVLCLAMLCLGGFTLWVARSPLPLVRAGALVLLVAGLTHLVENLLVLGPGRDGKDATPGVWHVIDALSPTAFAILGLGALLVSAGLPGPGWLRSWGAVAGVAGLVAGLSSVVTALGFLPPLFNVVLLGWLIALGLVLRPTAGS